MATLQSITWVKFERHKHLENIVDPLCQLLYKAVITKDGYYKAFFSLAEENKGLLNTIKQKSDECDLINRIKKREVAILRKEIGILKEKCNIQITEHEKTIDIIASSRSNLMSDVDRLEAELQSIKVIHKRCHVKNTRYEENIAHLNEEVYSLSNRVKILDKDNISKLQKISKLSDTIDQQQRIYAKYSEDISDENACSICYETVSGGEL